MFKRKTPAIENFGERLAGLRKAAGYTQVELAAEVGITQRMVAYYEGLAEPRRPKQIATNRLERRLLDTFIESERLKQRVNAQSDARTSAQGA